MKKLLYLLVCCGFLMSCNQPENSNPTTPEQDPQITRDLLQLQELFDTPGIAFGLIHNDSVIYAGAHGVRSLDTQQPMTTQSLFHMASVSKPFVATAVVQLVEAGKIDLNQKLTHYLPYFTMADERYKDITIEQMLAHTSGIPNIDDYEWDKPQYDDGAAERYVRSQKDFELDFTPGERYSYSNPAFDILCDVIAKASGMTFEAYMKEHIFKPAGMVNSTFFKPDVPEELAIQPHVLGDSLEIIVSDIYPYNRRHAGSSTLHSNVEDMLRWAQVNLNRGSIDGNQIYNEQSYQLLTRLHTPEGQRKVGLSWFIGTMNETPIYFHSGQDTGFKSFFGFLPEHKAGVVIMTNSDRFWTMNSAANLVKNAVFNDSLTPKGPIHYKLKDYILTDGIAKVKQIYRQEEQRSPQQYTFDAGDMDDLGYWLLDRNYNQAALDIFLFNTELDPEYPGWVDSVADAYRAMDSIDLAIQWYRKALAMKPDQEFSQRKLKELLSNQAE